MVRFGSTGHSEQRLILFSRVSPRDNDVYQGIIAHSTYASLIISGSVLPAIIPEIRNGICLGSLQRILAVFTYANRIYRVNYYIIDIRALMRSHTKQNQTSTGGGGYK